MGRFIFGGPVFSRKFTGNVHFFDRQGEVRGFRVPYIPGTVFKVWSYQRVIQAEKRPNCDIIDGITGLKKVYFSSCILDIWV